VWGQAALPNVLVPGLGWEPDVAVDPADPNHVIVANGFQLRISADGGATFPTSANAPGGGGGDGVLAFDGDGRLFWAYLSAAPWRAVVARIDPTTGAVVDPTTGAAGGSEVVMPLPANVFNDDKPWIAADSNPASPWAGNLYLVFSRAFSGNAGGCGCWRVMLSRSIDHGATWSAPAVISGDGEGFVWPAHVAVGPEGRLYVAYRADATTDGGQEAVIVIRSDDGGQDLVAGTVANKAVAIGNGLATSVDNVNGTPIPGVPFGLGLGERSSWVLPDPSRPGTVYLVANATPEANVASGLGNQADVLFARSTDSAATWSAPRTLNDDVGGTLHVFPRGAVDEAGRLAVFWYDSRRGASNASGNFLLDAFATISTDAGVTWSRNFPVSEAAMDPGTTNRLSEYYALTASQGTAWAAWIGTDPVYGTYLQRFSLLAPTLAPVVPDHGPVSGGTALSLTGSGLADLLDPVWRLTGSALAVQPGPAPGSFSAVAPAAPAGPAQVRLDSAQGGASASFTYYDPLVPVVVSVDGSCSETHVRVNVWDGTGQPLPNQLVRFSSARAFFLPAHAPTYEARTNQLGEAVALVGARASSVSWNATVTIENLSQGPPRGQATVSIASVPLASCIARATSAVRVALRPAVRDRLKLRPIIECAVVNCAAGADLVFRPVKGEAFGARFEYRLAAADRDSARRLGKEVSVSFLGREDIDQVLGSGTTFASESAGSAPVLQARLLGPLVTVAGPGAGRGFPVRPGSAAVRFVFDPTELTPSERPALARLDDTAKPPRWVRVGGARIELAGGSISAVPSGAGTYALWAVASGSPRLDRRQPHEAEGKR